MDESALAGCVPLVLVDRDDLPAKDGCCCSDEGLVREWLTDESVDRGPPALAALLPVALLLILLPPPTLPSNVPLQ